MSSTHGSVVTGSYSGGDGPQGCLHPFRQRLCELREAVAAQVQEMNARLCVEPADEARLAQVVAFVYSMRRHCGVVYFGTVQEAIAAVGVLCGSGLSVRDETRNAPSTKTRAQDIIVRTSGAATDVGDVAVRYILHASPPPSLETYLIDLAVGRESTPRPTSTIFFPHDGGSGAPEVDAYCRSETCRYAHLVRRSRPQLVEPEPRLFSCYRCDVCLAHPRGIHEEECGETVSVYVAPPGRETA